MRADLAAAFERMPFLDIHSHMAGFDCGSPLDDRRGMDLARLLTSDYLAPRRVVIVADRGFRRATFLNLLDSLGFGCGI